MNISTYIENYDDLLDGTSHHFIPTDIELHAFDGNLLLWDLLFLKIKGYL